MGQEIGLGTSWSAERRHDLSGDDIAAHNESARAMADIFKLTPLDFARNQRQTGMFAFECLDPGQFIRTEGSFALLSQAGSLFIQPTHAFDRFLPLWIVRWRQPVADQVRLEIPFFNNRAAWRGEICSTMPRAITSSAISRPVQWLIGRSLGCSQASATIWQVCSAVIWEGFPGRCISSDPAPTERSSSGTPCKPVQRVRQLRTVSTLTSRSLAIWLVFLPEAAARIIRPRRASCWGVLCRRTSASSSFCSFSFNVKTCGFGPRILFLLLRSADPILLQKYFRRSVLVILLNAL